MNNKIKIWTALCAAVCAIAFGACDDDKDLSYKGSLDLNMLGIKQARDMGRSAMQCIYKSERTASW